MCSDLCIGRERHAGTVQMDVIRQADLIFLWLISALFKVVLLPDLHGGDSVELFLLFTRAYKFTAFLYL